MSKRKKIKFIDENGVLRKIRPTYDKQGFLVFDNKHYIFTPSGFYGRK